MDIKDKIKLIKYSRMNSGERYIMDIIDKLVPSEHNSSPNQFVFKYKIDDIVVFSYDKRYKHLWYNYNTYNELSNIIDYIEHPWGYSNLDVEIDILLKYMIKEYLVKEDIVHTNHGTARSSNKVWKQV